MAHGKGMGAVASALRFEEAYNLHHGVAEESLLDRVSHGCRSVRLAANRVTIYQRQMCCFGFVCSAH